MDEALNNKIPKPCLLRCACLETRQKASVVIEKFEVLSQNLPRPDLLECRDEIPFDLHSLGASHESHGHLPKCKPVAALLVGPREPVAAAGAGDSFGFAVEHEVRFPLFRRHSYELVAQTGQFPIGVFERRR
jgi:hypothetical protein